MTLSEIKKALVGERLVYYSNMGEIVDIIRNYDDNNAYIYCQSGEFVNVPLGGIEYLAMYGECESKYEEYSSIKLEKKPTQKVKVYGVCNEKYGEVDSVYYFRTQAEERARDLNNYFSHRGSDKAYEVVEGEAAFAV